MSDVMLTKKFAVAMKFESEEHSVILLATLSIEPCKAYAMLVSCHREADHTEKIIGPCRYFGGHNPRQNSTSRFRRSVSTRNFAEAAVSSASFDSEN
jgi:hypothetical protein